MEQFISVIIPVFNDQKRLKSCLAALEKQTYPQDNYEVIVVDNGSDQSLESVIKEFSQAKLTYCAVPGSYAARNHGISLAQGEIIAFTDSDCIPNSNWLQAGVKHLSTTDNCGLVAGKIEMFYRKPDCPTAVELYDDVTFFNQKRYAQEQNYGATANVFTYKSVFEQVGLFNAQLKSGGDKEWGQRVAAQGYGVVYGEDSAIAHPARYSFKQIYRKIARVRGVGYEQERANKSLLAYLTGILPHLKPPIRSTKQKLSQLSQEGKISNIWQPLQILGLTFALHYLGFFAQTYRDR
ncbi:MAG: glycosyltransferase family A protein [Xenococcaceae cyanobacterium MO_167.B52]|nr:glycosyltransferase family A protein [Xenococcaceae cyanobacterium MO_167.B52]